MPFQIPENLHPDLMPVAFLLGHWHGDGHGDYPTIEKFEFGQEAAFTHDGRPFLHYFSRSWLVDADGNEVRPLALETGFLRPRPDGAVEFLLTHPTGIAEIYYGTVEGAKIEMATDAVVRTQSAKAYTAGQRLYGLVEGDLLWTFDMAAVGQPIRAHIWARLKRD
ncbi:MAG: FABP family protein [Nocardioidaceae bacterium]